MRHTVYGSCCPNHAEPLLIDSGLGAGEHMYIPSPKKLVCVGEEGKGEVGYDREPRVRHKTRSEQRHKLAKNKHTASQVTDTIRFHRPVGVCIWI